MPAELADHPVTHVDWHDANARLSARRPTPDGGRVGEGRAAAPTDAVTPGVTRRRGLCATNFGGGAKRGRTTPVARTRTAGAPTVSSTWPETSGSGRAVYAAYPYDRHDRREDPRSGLPRTLRGGSFASPTSRNLRCAARSRSAPGRRSPHIGFRIARKDNR